MKTRTATYALPSTSAARKPPKKPSIPSRNAKTVRTAPTAPAAPAAPAAPTAPAAPAAPTAPGCSDCSRRSDLKNARPVEAQQASADEGYGPPRVPIIPDIHKAVYAAASQPEALAMENVHTCANTHCRGGWVITLAGEAGRKLEEFFNWELAAMKIYDASAPGFKINPARFYDTNADALADMKRLAGAQTKGSAA